MGEVEEMEGGMEKVVRDREEIATVGIGKSRICLAGCDVADVLVVATPGGEEKEMDLL